MAATRRASPAHGHHAAVALWRGRDATRGNGAAQRSAVQTRRGAGQTRELGWAERGARERRAQRQAGPTSAVGRERRRRPAKGENIFLNFYFKEIFKYQFSNIILSKKMTSFENVPKRKIA